jgi:hypothetical protein
MCSQSLFSDSLLGARSARRARAATGAQPWPVNIGVTALRTDVEDVGEPFYPLTGKADVLDCNELPPDGWADLTVKFNLQDVVTALNTIEPLSDGQERVLMVTGKLLDGTDFVGEDVVQILKKK